MIFDPNNEIDRIKAKQRFDYLIDKGKQFELTEKRKRRSISQNSYLHLILSYFAHEYGETLDYVKRYFFKNVCNKDLFLTEYVNTKTGEIRKDWRSSADLDTKEMTTAIDSFIMYANKDAGIFLPSPSDLVNINLLEIEMSRYA